MIYGRKTHLLSNKLIFDKEVCVNHHAKVSEFIDMRWQLDNIRNYLPKDIIDKIGVSLFQLLELKIV